MKTPRALGAFIFICTLCCTFSAAAQQAQLPSSYWRVYFSPRGGATEAIVQTLDNATSSILVQAYSFTSIPIAEALVRAHQRGVKVQVLLDKGQGTQRSSVADLLIRASVPVLIDASHAIAHNKVMIIDGTTLITGSFNFTKAAEERNAENLLIIRSKELASLYIENWRLHRVHASFFYPQHRP